MKINGSLMVSTIVTALTLLVMACAQPTTAKSGIPHHVSYLPNGAGSGESPVDGEVYSESQTVTVMGNSGALKKSGFGFTDWNTKSDGSGTSYQFGSKLVMGSVDVTLIANWRVAYKVTYDPNEATVGNVPVDGTDYVSGQSAIVLPNSGHLARTGFTFIGWNLAADSTGQSYLPNSNLPMTGQAVTLFARWTTAPTYQVIYDRNGANTGSVPIDDNHYLAGAFVSLLDNPGVLVKSGFLFGGWSRASSGTAAISSVVIASSDETLFAVWIPLYRVYYAENGSTGGGVPNDTSGYIEGATVNVFGNSGLLTKTNFVFGGWSMLSGGPDVGNSIIMGATDITLFALWQPTYTVTYDLNSYNGTVPLDSKRYLAGDYLNLQSPSTNKPGTVFGGWTINPDGTGTKYYGGYYYGMGATDVKFYALWIPVFHVTYPEFVGSLSDSKNYQVGQTATILEASPQKSGYFWVGWNTQPDGTGTHYPASCPDFPKSFTIGNSDVALYTEWVLYGSSPVYQVGRNLNGGTGAPPYDSALYLPGETVQIGLGLPAYSRPTKTVNGVVHTLGHWNTSPTGTGISYYYGDSFVISASITLYGIYN